MPDAATSSTPAVTDGHTAPPARAVLTVAPDGSAVLALSGTWLRHDDCPYWHDVLADHTPKKLAITDDGLGAWNSVLVNFLYNTVQHLRTHGTVCDWQALPSGPATLLNLATAVPEKRFRTPEAEGVFLERLGRSAVDAWGSTRRALEFIGILTCACLRFAVGRTRTPKADILFQFARCGHQAIGIVSLMGFLIGVILAFIGSIPLRMFGAEIYIATLVGIGILRMMAASTTGTVMAGRTGAAFAAELGAMQTNEEVDAYIAMGLSPVEILILPRFLALSLAMPLLCLYSDLLGLLGGLAVGVYYSGLSASAFLEHLYSTTSLNDFFVGLFTSWVFGILISACGCYHGLHCGRNSTAVGQAATSAVVSSIVCMVLATAVITLSTVILNI